MTSYTLNGQTESNAKTVLPIDVKVERAIRLSGASRAGFSDQTVTIADDELVEVELETGFTLWTTMGQLKSDCDLPTSSSRSNKSDDGFPLRYPQPIGGQQRGIASIAIRLIKVLGYNVPQEGALAIAAKVESQLRGHGEFFRVAAGGEMEHAHPPTISDAGPTLVLIHGTASSCTNAFAGFFDQSMRIWEKIHAHYNGRVFAFDHRTLTESPLENAIQFLKAIPQDAELHLITHSRGGLIGDLVAHGQVGKTVFAEDTVEKVLRSTLNQRSAEYNRQLALYRKYNELIVAKRPNVARYVRVACPAGGTTLASKRLDIYMSILVNLVGMVPGVGPFLEGIGELAAAVAKERTNPEVVPGLEAQMPSSPFIRLLNDSQHELTTDLTVLAGDSDGFWKNLANLFYFRRNDLVVDTRSMFGGAVRQQRLWHLEENRHVTHINYFQRPETAEVVSRGLLRDDSDIEGFYASKPKGALRGRVDKGNPKSRTDLPAVIVLPGIMGSTLEEKKNDRGDLLWLDKSDLFWGRGKRLSIGSGKNIQPVGLIDSAYGNFCDYLGRQGIQVLPMPYDWRVSLEDGVNRLDALVQERLEASDQPVHLIAHSMGGVLASLFISRQHATWQRLRDSGGRLVQAGTPNRGSHVITRILQGEEKMIRLIAGLDMKNGLSDWVKWVSHFRGVLELAPTYDKDLDLSTEAGWTQLKVRTVPRAADLKAVKSVWGDLKTQAATLAEEGVLYVAGGPNPTPVYDSSTGKIAFTKRGDGRVAWEWGVPPKVPTWYINTKHGSLLDDKGSFAGLRELLLTGTTSQLSKGLPATDAKLRSADEVDTELSAPYEMAALGTNVDRSSTDLEYIPSNLELEAAALDMVDPFQSSGSDLMPLQPCKVSVTHGDLRFSKHAVLVGHYRGDQIVSAEAVLDRQLRGSMRRSYWLRVYPGALGTSEIFVMSRENESANSLSPKVAVVVGLGDVGELTITSLARAVEGGLLRYAKSCMEKGDSSCALQISTLLVGSGEAGLGVSQVIEAFLLALESANRVLRSLQAGVETHARPDSLADSPSVYFSELEFIELFQDIALEALHALKNRPPSALFSTSEVLHKRGGRLQRARTGLAPMWWNRLQIRSRILTEDDCGAGKNLEIQALEFTSYGDRARASENSTHVQRAYIDFVLGDTLSQGHELAEGLPQALFEQLIPAALKGLAIEGRNVQLDLDEGSAAYPWELLRDRRAEYDRPAFGFGVLRQLRVSEPPEVQHPEQNVILVVGDPPSSLPELPEAQLEAEAVYELFSRREGWKALPQIRHRQPDVSASSIMSSVQTSDYRILHLAGHGDYDPKCVHRTGMIIGNSENTDVESPFIFLNPEEIRKSPLKPELVFINCCHSGAIQQGTMMHKLAANLAAEFIRAGVKAVVAAGWSISDDAARRFAEEFYLNLLSGADFGAAVSAARESIYRYGGNTWGAYQCYGDPGYRLLIDQNVREKTSGAGMRESNLLDPSELVMEAANLANNMKVQNSEAEQSDIEAQLDNLRALAEGKAWLSQPQVQITLARVYGELGNFEQAISYHEAAMAQERSDVTLKDLERMANYRARLGEKKRNLALVNKAIKELKNLLRDHGETSERLSTLAAAYKRRIQVRIAKSQAPGGTSAKSKVLVDLVEMTAVYIEAAEIRASNWHYPATNALLGMILLGGAGSRKPRGIPAKDWEKLTWRHTDVFTSVIADISAMISSSTVDDFWGAIAEADLELVKALASNTFDTELERLVKMYTDQFARIGSRKEIDSIMNHWEFASAAANICGRIAIASGFEKLIASVKNKASE